MRWFFYNLLFYIAGIFLLPHFYLKMKRRGGYKSNFQNRFGQYSQDQINALQKARPILIHAVSVGEVGVAFQFMDAYRKLVPSQHFVISTTSSTGWKEAEKRLSANDCLIYNAIDLPFCVRRQLDAIQPTAFIMVETEIWPNLIRSCARRTIPMAIINGRLSDKTAPTYRRLRFWFGPALRLIHQILVQSDLDASRYIAAGANASTVSVTGSFKFDVARRNLPKEEMWKNLLEKLALSSPQQILLGASTWEGEEKILLSAYANLLPRFPSLRLVLVPRHFERRSAIEAEITSMGFRPIRKSDLDNGILSPSPLSSHDILLADTTGEMMGLFPFSTITVIGRTFCSFGGQNMIEPCLCGVPTIVGPETQNFRPVMADLLAANALIQLPNATALEPEITRLLNDAPARKTLGASATSAVEKRRGVVNRVAQMIASTIPSN